MTPTLEPTVTPYITATPIPSFENMGVFDASVSLMTENIITIFLACMTFIMLAAAVVSVIQIVRALIEKNL